MYVQHYITYKNNSSQSMNAFKLLLYIIKCFSFVLFDKYQKSQRKTMGITKFTELPSLRKDYLNFRTCV